VQGNAGRIGYCKSWIIKKCRLPVFFDFDIREGFNHKMLPAMQ